MKRKNLRKLAVYLLGLPKGYKHFYMGNFYEVGDREFQPNRVTIPEMSCGAVACALGHGINAGIKCTKSIDDWIDYGNENFINHKKEYSKWQWCFSGNWEWTDNTPQGAGKRILWLLENGLPKNWQDQRDGDANLCYLEMKV